MIKRTKNISDKINIFISKIKFKSLNLNFSKQITIIGCIIGIISLFLPWIIDLSVDSRSWNSFNTISGNIGYLLIFIYLLPIFIIFSTSYKEKIKLYSDLNFKNHFIIITCAIIIICFSIITLSFVNGLHTFFENIIYGKGAILSMTSGILIFIGGIIIREDFRKNNSEIILDKLSQNREQIRDKDNMVLPF